MPHGQSADFWKRQARAWHVINGSTQRIESPGETLDPKKCEFGKSQLKFLGHLMHWEETWPDRSKITTITDIELLTNVSELLHFLRMVSQLGKLSEKLTDLTQPLRQLLSTKTTWLCSCHQAREFADVKVELAKPRVLTPYNPLVQTKVIADALSYGLGAMLMQKCGALWQTATYTPRTMTDAKQCYAQIEKEVSATVWECEKFATYIIGLKLLKFLILVNK